MTGIAMAFMASIAARDTFFQISVEGPHYWSHCGERFEYWFSLGVDGMGARWYYDAINDTLNKYTDLQDPLDSLDYFTRGMAVDWLWGQTCDPNVITSHRHFPFPANSITNDTLEPNYQTVLTRFDSLAFWAISHSNALKPYGWYPYNATALDSLDERVYADISGTVNNGGYEIRYLEFHNEPDHTMRKVQRGFFTVYVDSTNPWNQEVPDTLVHDTAITHGNTEYHIRIIRLMDSTTVGGTKITTKIDWDSLAILEFKFRWVIDEPDSLIDTVVCRVRPNSLVQKFRTHYWGAVYMADSIMPKIYEGVKRFDQDIMVCMPAWAHNAGIRDFDNPPDDFIAWVGPWWYDPSVVKAGNDSTYSLLKMQDQFLDELTDHNPVPLDIINYHLYMACEYSADSGDPDNNSWYDPYDTLKIILDSLKAIHQKYGLTKPVLISEFGGQTPQDGQNPASIAYPRQAKCLAHYYDVFRLYRGAQNFDIDIARYFSLRQGCPYERYDILVMKDSLPDEAFYPKPAYYAFLNYLAAYRGDKARGDGDTLLASRDPKATFGPGNKMDAVYVDQPPVRKYWVAFPFKQYDPAQKALVLKGIRVLRIDTLGNADSVVNLTGSPYNKVDQLAIAGADNAPCIAFTTSDSGNIYYAYIGASVSRTLLWRNDAYRDSAYFPLLENEGNYIHLVFYGKSTKPEYGNGIHWMKFAYNNPGSPSVNTSVYYGEIPDWVSFDLNSANRPWIVWEHGDSVYLVRHTGLAWGDFKTVASSGAKWPDIAMSGSDTAWVAWHNSDRDSVFVKGYRPYALVGPIFSGPVGRARADSSFPRIDLSGTTVFLLLADSNIVQVGEVSPNPNPYKPWSFDTRLAKGVQGPFGYSFTNALLESTPLHSLYPDLVARSATRIMALWTEGEYDAERVWFRAQVVE